MIPFTSSAPDQEPIPDQTPETLHAQQFDASPLTKTIELRDIIENPSAIIHEEKDAFRLFFYTIIKKTTEQIINDFVIALTSSRLRVHEVQLHASFTHNPFINHHDPKPQNLIPILWGHYGACFDEKYKYNANDRQDGKLFNFLQYMLHLYHAIGLTGPYFETVEYMLRQNEIIKGKIIPFNPDILSEWEDEGSLMWPVWSLNLEYPGEESELWNDISSLFNPAIYASPNHIIVPALFEARECFEKKIARTLSYYSGRMDEIVKTHHDRTYAALFFHPIMIQFWSALVNVKGIAALRDAFQPYLQNYPKEESGLFSKYFPIFLDVMQVFGPEGNDINPMHVNFSIFAKIPPVYAANYYTPHRDNYPSVGQTYQVAIPRPIQPY